MAGEDGKSLLDLPPELRLLVYEQLLQDPVVFVKCLADSAKVVKSPWALLRVCRLIRHEAFSMLPAISKVDFQFTNVNEDGMKRWCQSMGPTRIQQMRKISLTGSGICLTGWDEINESRADAPPCMRTITLNLDRGFRRPFSRERLHQETTDGSLVTPHPPHDWHSLDAFQSDDFCQRGCLGCRYCTQVVAVGQVSKMQWSADGQPMPSVDLLMDLVDTTTKDISMYLCPQGCGVKHCNSQKGELNTGGSSDAFLQLLRLRDYNERYLVE